MAFVRDDSISLKGSTSALPNNLSIVPFEKDKELTLVNKSTAYLVRLDERGRVKSQVDLKYKHPSENKLLHITQVSLV